jgi:hypothetical protein
MPVLPNPRHEAFAQAIVAGYAGRKLNGQSFSQANAYLIAGYAAANRNTADACASRLLRIAKIVDRVIELRDELNKSLQQKNRYSIETLSERMALASQIAEEDRNPSALYGAEKAIAELRGLIVDPTKQANSADFSQAKSMQDIGRALLAQLDWKDPPTDAIDSAIEAHDRFVAELQLIYERHQGLVIEHE